MSENLSSVEVAAWGLDNLRPAQQQLGTVVKHLETVVGGDCVGAALGAWVAEFQIKGHAFKAAILVVADKPAALTLLPKTRAELLKLVRYHEIRAALQTEQSIENLLSRPTDVQAPAGLAFAFMFETHRVLPVTRLTEIEGSVLDIRIPAIHDRRPLERSSTLFNVMPETCMLFASPRQWVYATHFNFGMHSHPEWRAFCDDMRARNYTFDYSRITSGSYDDAALIAQVRQLGASERQLQVLKTKPRADEEAEKIIHFSLVGSFKLEKWDTYPAARFLMGKQVAEQANQAPPPVRTAGSKRKRKAASASQSTQAEENAGATPVQLIGFVPHDAPQLRDARPLLAFSIPDNINLASLVSQMRAVAVLQPDAKLAYLYEYDTA